MKTWKDVKIFSSISMIIASEGNESFAIDRYNAPSRFLKVIKLFRTNLTGADHHLEVTNGKSKEKIVGSFYKW